MTEARRRSRPRGTTCARPPARTRRPKRASSRAPRESATSRGARLLASENPHAAVVALERARELEPDKGSVRETLARAYFRTGRFPAAREEFARAVEIDPVNDYAHFGLALACERTGQRARAIAHLKLAVAMRPGVSHYEHALARLTG